MLQLNNRQKEALAKICDALAIASFVGFGASFAGAGALSFLQRIFLLGTGAALVTFGLLLRGGEENA